MDPVKETPIYFAVRVQGVMLGRHEVELPSQQTNLAQIWHASGTAGIHPALAYSMWAKHGPGLAEVVPGLRRHTRHRGAPKGWPGVAMATTV